MLIKLQINSLLQKEMEKHARRKKVSLSEVISKCLETNLGNTMRERAARRFQEIEYLKVEADSIKRALVRNFKEVTYKVSLRKCKKIIKPTLKELDEYGEYPSWMYNYYFKSYKKFVKMVGG